MSSKELLKIFGLTTLILIGSSILFFFLSGGVFVVTYIFLVQPNKIVGDSMEPTYSSGAYILSEKISYRNNDPRRGDIVVFRPPSRPEVNYIHRVIGLPGETIRFQNGKVYIDNVLLEEPYLSATATTQEGAFLKENVTAQIPEDGYFVIGDNRPYVAGSHEFGFIKKEDVVGRVIFCYTNCN